MAQQLDWRNRNIVVIGGSAGSLDALSQIVRHLPGDFPAAVLFVQHLPATHTSALPDILAQRTALTVREATDGASLTAGTLSTCVPDYHLVLSEANMHLTRGPRENHSRPAIDTLFRSAARHYRGRVVAVLLSGYLSDGLAGLSAVRRCGGLTVVQDPADASVADMPQNALDRHEADFVADARRIGDLLREIVTQPAPSDPDVPDDVILETEMTVGRRMTIRSEDRIGELTPFACPDCSGNLWRVHDDVLRFRCHVGHAYTAADFAAAEQEKLEEALWTALRGLRERAELLATMASDARAAKRSASADRFAANASEIEEQANRLQDFIMTRTSVYA
ncbi:chemotaxis protein CheB [Acuticoccus sp. MNP-M23]|uniref:chemotaxis protein CheB n=1 Tax=Acuticoccus sp. MNP-M23 TaxID=3072793 RepID=UPI0028154D14|nr:chemotaxis protein CheB [Acuticoccus sp. MNP-M23]WMS43743.1 chemotaxis protein CheB [Acuticoccus sp. MNP-M23]